MFALIDYAISHARLTLATLFFLLIAVPFLYEWKSGYLEWVRSSSAQAPPASAATTDAAARASAAARAWT